MARRPTLFRAPSNEIDQIELNGALKLATSTRHMRFLRGLGALGVEDARA
jgi:hypothetical protein